MTYDLRLTGSTVVNLYRSRLPPYCIKTTILNGHCIDPIIPQQVAYYMKSS